MKIGEQTIIFLAVNKNGDEIILDNTPARQGEIWTDERSTHDEEYFSIEDHNSAIVLPKGTIRRLTGRDLKWEDDPISLKSKSVCKRNLALVKTLLTIFPLYHIHETQVLS